MFEGYTFIVTNRHGIGNASGLFFFSFFYTTFLKGNDSFQLVTPDIMCSYIIYNFIKKETGFYTFFFELKQLESLEMNYSLSGSVCSHINYEKKETIILFRLLHTFR